MAIPDEFVVEVADEKEPPAADVDQVTVLDASGTLLPPESFNCAVTLIDVPATGVVDERVTAYVCGAPKGVTEFDGLDAGPVPCELVAVTVKV